MTASLLSKRVEKPSPHFDLFSPQKTGSRDDGGSPDQSLRSLRLLRRVRTHMEKPVCKMADMNALPHCGNP